jgi:hypothetical protein
MFTSSTRAHSSGRSYPIPLSRLETRVDVRVTLQYGGLNGETRGQRSPDAGKIIGSVVLEYSFELDDSHMTAEFAARCALSLAHLVDYRRKNRQLYAWVLRAPSLYFVPLDSQQTSITPSMGVVFTHHKYHEDARANTTHLPSRLE